MFHHPAWAVGSYSSGPPAARSAGTKSAGGFPRPLGSPCTSIGIVFDMTTSVADDNQLTFCADNLLGILLQPERHVPDPDLPHCEVRPVHLPLLAQLCQELHWLHGIPPLIVTAAEGETNH